MAPFWWVALIATGAYSLALVVPAWRVCDRVGRARGLGLLMLLPVVGWFAVMAVLAFGSWPARLADGPDPDKSIVI